MGTESIEASFLSIFALISFFIFLLISKYSQKIRSGALLDKDFLKPQAFHDFPIRALKLPANHEKQVVALFAFVPPYICISGSLMPCKR